MNRDLQDFSSDISWFLLTKLLKKARITKIRYKEKCYELFGWSDENSETFGWLCLEPDLRIKNIEQLHPHHILLLKNFGGILGRWNEPEDTWLLNLNSALIYEEATEGLNGYEDLLNEICDNEGILNDVDTKDFVSFAIEANGNITMYHQKTGKLLMYAHDHNFHYVTPYQNYPKYTFYEFNDCKVFKDWVEQIANQTLRYVNHSN